MGNIKRNYHIPRGKSIGLAMFTSMVIAVALGTNTYATDELEYDIANSKLFKELSLGNMALLDSAAIQLLYLLKTDDTQFQKLWIAYEKLDASEKHFILSSPYAWAGRIIAEAVYEMDITFDIAFKLVPLKELCEKYSIYHSVHPHYALSELYLERARAQGYDVPVF